MKRQSSVRESLTIPTAKHSKTRNNNKDGLPTDTEAGLYYLQRLIPRGLIPASTNGLSIPTLPPIVLKHQIYSIIKDKTIVDREIMSLRNNGILRIIKLDQGNEDFCVIMTEDYCQLIKHQLKGKPLLCDKVIDSLLPSCMDISVSKTQLTENLSFSDDQISVLVQEGLLLVRDVGKRSASWWFTLPYISQFKSHLSKGRNSIKQKLKRTKNKEILQKELECKKITGKNPLPMEYFIHDIIGSEMVESIETSSGPLLRLVI